MRKRLSKAEASSPVLEDVEFQHNRETFDSATRKRPRLQRGLSYDNVITEGLPVQKTTASPSADSPPMPSHAHPTRGRLRGHPKVNYDVRFHPADKVLRPNHAATIAARQAERSKNDAELDGDDQDDLNDEECHEVEVRISSSRNSRKHEEEYSSTRTGRQVKVPNYDMKHHPMDDTLRPKAAAKRSVQFRKSSVLAKRGDPTSGLETKSAITASNPLSGLTADVHSGPASDRADTTSSQPTGLYNPFIQPLSDDWNKLNAFDRRLYQLQQGISLTSGLVPLAWSEVVRGLVEENLLSDEQLRAYGGRAVLKTRYEDIRLRVRISGSTLSDECKSTSDVVDQNFDVFDLPGGAKYWKRKRDWEMVAQQSTTRAMIDEASAVQASVVAEKIADGRKYEESLMDLLRNDIAASIEPLIDQDEEAELGKVQNIQRHAKTNPEPVNVKGDEEYINPAVLTFDVIAEVEAEAEAEASSSLESQGLTLSPNAPPGAKRAARRFDKDNRSREKKQTKEKRKQIERESLPQKMSAAYGLKKPQPIDTSFNDTAAMALTPASDKNPVEHRISKKARRKSRRTSFKVHENQPLEGKEISSHAVSPGTNVAKENWNEEHNNPQNSSVHHAHHRLQPSLDRLSETPSPASVGEAIPDSSHSIIPTFPIFAYPADPTVTMFTPINRARTRARPVAAEFYSV